MGFVKFENGIYTAKSKQESDIMSAFIGGDKLYEEITVENTDCFYKGILKSLSPNIMRFELEYYKKDFDKFKHLTLAEIMKSYEIPTSEK